MGVGGSGGGYIGENGNSGTGGNQTSGGSGVGYGTFGQGGSCGASNGGGDGWYGGGLSWNSDNYTAGGGSGYIGNSLLADKHMTRYRVSTSDDESTKTNSTDKVSSTPTEDYAKSGGGYARITYIGS